MIRKVFNDGCFGVKLYGSEAKESNFHKYIREVSPLNKSDTDLLIEKIIEREENSNAVFAESGYMVGWKRSPNFSFIIVVFKPLSELQGGEEASGNGYL